MNLAIIILAGSCYIVGYRSIISGQYKPSIYSRAIWSFIALNSFVSVLALHNSTAVMTLSAVQFTGCVVMLLSAWRYSIKTFGKTEYICTWLLISSLLVWFAFKSPILNLILGIVAHFIGGIPSLSQVIKHPKKENFLFWLFFASASALTFISTDKSNFQGYLYPLYFMCFEGSMAILASRQYFPFRLNQEVRPSTAPQSFEQPGQD